MCDEVHRESIQQHYDTHLRRTRAVSITQEHLLLVRVRFTQSSVSWSQARGLEHVTCSVNANVAKLIITNCQDPFDLILGSGIDQLLANYTVASSTAHRYSLGISRTSNSHRLHN